LKKSIKPSDSYDEKKLELAEKEIEEKRKLPFDLKNEIFKSIFHNLLIAIIIMVFLCVVNVIFRFLDEVSFEIAMKYLALFIIIITVIVIEVAYRRQSKRTALIGIELLLISVFSLYVPYFYLMASPFFMKLSIVVPGLIAFYYVIKALLIFKSGEIKYHDDLSDVKEILKEEKKSYIDEFEEEEEKKTKKSKKKENK
jgi:amino acid transporter